MAQQNERQKKAEQHLTDELANQARQEPGSAEESESKEKRAQAEKSFRTLHNIRARLFPSRSGHHEHFTPGGAMVGQTTPSAL
jgi:hypothetical protein